MRIFLYKVETNCLFIVFEVTVLYPTGWLAGFCYDGLLLLGWPDVVRLGDGCYADRLCEAGWLLLCWLATC